VPGQLRAIHSQHFPFDSYTHLVIRIHPLIAINDFTLSVRIEYILSFVFKSPHAPLFYAYNGFLVISSHSFNPFHAFEAMPPFSLLEHLGQGRDKESLLALHFIVVQTLRCQKSFLEIPCTSVSDTSSLVELEFGDTPFFV
jgi:hypothetical protein